MVGLSRSINLMSWYVFERNFPLGMDGIVGISVYPCGFGGGGVNVIGNEAFC